MIKVITSSGFGLEVCPQEENGIRQRKKNTKYLFIKTSGRYGSKIFPSG
jgi:hypothetical protein